MTVIKEVELGIQLKVRVQPRASRNEITGLLGEELKIRLTAPPVEGEANAALCAFLANILGVPKAAVTLVAGQSSRSKTVRVNGIDPAQARVKLKI